MSREEMDENPKKKKTDSPKAKRGRPKKEPYDSKAMTKINMKINAELNECLENCPDQGVTGKMLIDDYLCLSMKERQSFLNMVKTISMNQ